MIKILLVLLGCFFFLSCNYRNEDIRKSNTRCLDLSSSVAPQTQVSLSTVSLDLGTFSSTEKQKGIFQLKNAGKNPLVINAVTTSCGCTQVDYEKQPIPPGGTTHLTVNYKADHPEHFNKTILVYCNAKESPIQLTITGEAR